MKDASYHRAALKYNEELAEFAEKLSGKLEHDEVSRWSRAVSKQHRFHAGRHARALHKLENQRGKNAVETEDGSESTNVSIAEQQAQFAAQQTESSPDSTQAAAPVPNQGQTNG